MINGARFVQSNKSVRIADYIKAISKEKNIRKKSEGKVQGKFYNSKFYKGFMIWE
jgi:hypothetical protein